MRMRVLICDDEGIVRDSLKFIIQKNFGDEMEVECAKNGRTAIELAEAFRPDIILMDIQMPGINGIEAMREIRKEHKNIVIIVLTAYDKFEYTQQSIDVGVLAYLTKPISRDILVETLRKAAKIVKESKEKASRELEIKEKMEAVIPMIESGLIYSMLLEDSGDEKNNSYRELLDLTEEYGYVMVIECGDELHKGMLSNEVGAGITLQKHYMVFREIVKEATGGIVGSLMANKVIVIIPSESGKEAYEERLVKIENSRGMLRKLERQTGLKFKAGVGSVKSWRFLVESYQEALDTVRQGSGKVTHAKDLPVSCIYEESYPYELEKRLFDTVAKGRMEETRKLSIEFFVWMEGHTKNLNNAARLKAMEFVLWAEHLAYMQGGMVYRFGDREGYLDTLMSFCTYQELRGWFVKKIEEASRHVAMKQKEKTDNIIEKAKEYISVHFLKELSREELARELGISPYYLSRLFKEAEGVNYIDYVTALRIDYAKKQLVEGNKSIKEICLESGYGDPNYFSRIFKKWTGKTPTEYREGGSGKWENL